MNIFLQILLLALPVVAEVVIDKIMWKMGLSDKPLSTIVRGAMFIVLAISFDLSGLNSWWQTLIFVTTIHWLLFDYIINKARGSKWYHIGTQDKLYERVRYYMTVPGELLFKIIIVMAGYGVYAHLDWIV